MAFSHYDEDPFDRPFAAPDTHRKFLGRALWDANVRCLTHSLSALLLSAGAVVMSAAGPHLAPAILIFVPGASFFIFLSIRWSLKARKCRTDLDEETIREVQEC